MAATLNPQQFNEHLQSLIDARKVDRDVCPTCRGIGTSARKSETMSTYYRQCPTCHGLGTPGEGE